MPTKWIYGFREVGPRPLSQEERAMLHRYEVAGRRKVAVFAVAAIAGGILLLSSISVLAPLPRPFWMLYVVLVAAYIWLLWVLGQSDLSRLTTRQVLKAGFVTRFERQEMPTAVIQAYCDVERQNGWEEEVQYYIDSFERSLAKAAGCEVTWFETIGESNTIHSVEGLRLANGPSFASVEVPEDSSPLS